MPTLLVKNIHTLVTMDATRQEIRNAAIFVRDNAIEQVGTTAALPPTADDIFGFARAARCPARSRQYASSLLPNPDAGCSSSAGLQSLQLAANAVSHLGKTDRKRGCDQRSDGGGRIDAVGLHDCQRPSLSLPQ